MVALGAQHQLVHILGESQADMAQQAAALLWRLAANSPVRKDSVAAAGAIPPLVSLLSLASTFAAQVRLAMAGRSCCLATTCHQSSLVCIAESNSGTCLWLLKLLGLKDLCSSCKDTSRFHHVAPVSRSIMVPFFVP